MNEGFFDIDLPAMTMYERKEELKLRISNIFI